MTPRFYYYGETPYITEHSAGTTLGEGTFQAHTGRKDARTGRVKSRLPPHKMTPFPCILISQTEANKITIILRPFSAKTLRNAFQRFFVWICGESTFTNWWSPFSARPAFLLRFRKLRFLNFGKTYWQHDEVAGRHLQLLPFITNVLEFLGSYADEMYLNWIELNAIHDLWPYHPSRWALFYFSCELSLFLCSLLATAVLEKRLVIKREFIYWQPGERERNWFGRQSQVACMLCFPCQEVWLSTATEWRTEWMNQRETRQSEWKFNEIFGF